MRMKSDHAEPISTATGRAIARLVYVAKRRNDGSVERAYERFKQQIAQFLPRMILVVMGPAFFCRLIPSEMISTHLGKDAGWTPIFPWRFRRNACPGRSRSRVHDGSYLSWSPDRQPVALVAFVTAWCIFAIHRILIYETHLAGPRFLMIRCIVAAPIPFVAGFITHLVTNF